MSGVTLYRPDDEGNLILLAEDEESDNAAITLDEFLDAADEDDHSPIYLALVGDVEEGEARAYVLTLDDPEPVNPRRAITVVGEDNPVQAAPKRRGRPPKAAQVETEEAPKRRGRPPGSKNKPGAKKPGPKPTAKRGPGRPPGSKNKPTEKKSGITKNPASEE